MMEESANRVAPKRTGRRIGRYTLVEELGRLQDEHRLLAEDMALKDDFVLEVRAQAAAEVADLEEQLAEARDQVSTFERLIRSQAEGTTKAMWSIR